MVQGFSVISGMRNLLCTLNFVSCCLHSGGGWWCAAAHGSSRLPPVYHIYSQHRKCTDILHPLTAQKVHRYMHTWTELISPSPGCGRCIINVVITLAHADIQVVLAVTNLKQIKHHPYISVLEKVHLQWESVDTIYKYTRAQTKLITEKKFLPSVWYKCIYLTHSVHTWYILNFTFIIHAPYMSLRCIVWSACIYLLTTCVTRTH